jgi:carboxyl-terminal processing protease
MRKKINNKIIIVFISAVLLSLATVFVAFNDRNDFEISKNLDIYYTLFKELNVFYVDEIDPAELVKTSIDKMLESLDPYTNFYPESQMEDYKFMTTGEYGGVGAVIRQYEGEVIIAEIYEDFPAHISGLKVGDAIYEIDGKNARGKSTEEISSMLKGQPGTSFKIKVKRYGQDELLTKEIIRQKIQIKSVPYYGMLEDNIGYMTLSSFTEKSGEDVKKAFLDLKQMGAEKIVFDLRGNPGGLLMEAVKISNYFIDKGQEIVSTRGKFKKFDSYYPTTNDALDTQIPIVVLVNRGSASASEIVAGAIQDLDRGVVIGQRTFGKGLVQSTRDLSYNTKLKVTTAKYYIPSGRCIQALDYSHRNEDGSVGKIPDSLTTKFKTKVGRTVYDGGGIVPDLIIEEEEMSKYILELLSKNLVFEFANEFCLRHEKIESAKTFEVPDTEIEKLEQFIASKNFEYKTETEIFIDRLERKANEENYVDGIKDEIELMRKNLSSKKEKSFERNKETIKRILKNEIVTRYYYQKGAIEAQLSKDKDLKMAIEVLKDVTVYNSILEGKHGEHLIEY